MAKSNDKITTIAIAAVIIVALAVGFLAFNRIDSTGKTGNNLGDAFTYDLSRQKQVDPALIIYDEIIRFTPEINSPHAIAVQKHSADESTLFIAGADSIKTYDIPNTLTAPLIEKLTIPIKAPASCIAVAKDGTIVVGMTDSISLFNPQGELLKNWTIPGDKPFLTSLAIQKDHIFAADAGNRIVHHYNRQGELVSMIGQKDPDRNIPGFFVPSPYFDLAISSDGLLRVVNPGRHQIEAYTFKGDLELSWGKASASIDGFCGCCNPSHFTLTSNDEFITSEKGLTRVKSYDHNGAFLGVVAPPANFEKHDELVNEKSASGFTGSLDLATDHLDRVIILDVATSEIRIMAKK